MPLQVIKLAPGCNQENSRYFSESGWYESDKIRFRQGTPEVIGGWVRTSSATFLGVCRSLWNWVTLASLRLIGVGTNLKFYIAEHESFYDITPIRLRTATATLTDPFATTNTLYTVSVLDTGHGASAGDLVSFTGASAVGGVPALDLNKQHVITSVTDANNYVITVATAATSTVAAGGGTVTTVYQYKNTTLGASPFATVNASTTVTVTAVAHGATSYDFVTFSNATAVAGLTISGEYQIGVVLDPDYFTITAASAANATTTGGGSAVMVQYQINTGAEIQLPIYGWGAGYWGYSTWGSGAAAEGTALRIWSQANYGEDLVFGPRAGGVYYWDASAGVGTRGLELSAIPGASYVPVVQLVLLVSDVSRFVIAFGCNDLDSTTLDPLLIRWSDQEDVLNWFPEITNQAGSLRLSNGSEIYAALQVRQEILVWTDTALYSMQFLGAPLVWGATLLESNITVMSPKSVVVAAGVSYWMGVGKFYKYDGRVQTLRCDLRQYIFSDFNYDQNFQVFAASNEGFNEVWWWYCSAASTTADRYVVYNYLEDIW